MSSKRESVEQLNIEEMSEEEQGQLLAMLMRKTEVCKIAKDSFDASGIKVSATKSPAERGPTKSQIMAELTTHVSAMYADEYNEAQDLVTAISSRAMDHLNSLCEEKGIDSPKRAGWAVKENGDGSTSFVFKTKGNSQGAWPPAQYVAKDNANPENSNAIALVEASLELGEPATLAVLKKQAGLPAKGNKLGSTMTDFFNVTGHINRPAA